MKMYICRRGYCWWQAGLEMTKPRSARISNIMTLVCTHALVFVDLLLKRLGLLMSCAGISLRLTMITLPMDDGPAHWTCFSPLQQIGETMLRVLPSLGILKQRSGTVNSRAPPSAYQGITREAYGCGSCTV